jgi:hypothetical protein
MCVASTNILLLADHDVPKSRRNPSVFSQRLQWIEFATKHGSHAMFRRHLRMSLSSFEKLLSYISYDLAVDAEFALLRGGQIIPEIQLYCTIRWLAGGSYSDIFYFCGISSTSFYVVVWRTIHAINKAEELAITFPQTPEECEAAALGFRSISSGEAMDTTVSVHDGYHLEIITPSKKEAKNVRSFFLDIIRPME